MKPRSLVPLLLLVPLLVVPVTSSPAEAAPGRPTCQGKRATIVGDGTRKVLRGTRRADVIVTRGSSLVLPGRGDDRVCVTGSAGRTAQVVDLAGDDRVVVQMRRAATVYAQLGQGRDYYRGGIGSDRVTGNKYGGNGDHEGDDDAYDDIATGAGDDSVVTGGPRGVGDRIDLGPGSDTLELRATRFDGGRLVGGAGFDRLMVEPDLGLDTAVDVPAGTITSDGTPVVAHEDFETYDLRLAVSGRLRFTGSDAGEQLNAGGVSRLEAAMGGGGDSVFVGWAQSPPSIDVDGGAGTDALTVAGEDLLIDVPGGTASTTGTLPDVRFAGFDTYLGVGARVTIQGGDTADKLSAYGCDVVVRGGGGDDRLEAVEGFFDEDFDCDGITGEVHGDGGDDVLIGNRADNLLDGGEGTDSADGAAGNDTCLAEARVRCES
ncbi:calcium-binding protein [Nocardioides sp.]|uniref:calcium-binding protein n=1 Tax=Nocardioides sp. TaxID=35761 RepID=UPI002715AA43|nr:hypothetical protein [Nocardioides sp.]MDO9455595.1 hypothetical protein [Nocardioides sp.]